MRLLSGAGHYDVVLDAVRGARHSVWIATANLKEMMVADSGLRRRRFVSVLSILDDLVKAGVEIRLLHGGPPSRAFRRSFDRHRRLYEGGLEMRQCPRVHLKTVIVDAETCYLGSANWTGAGLGAKGEHRRNFEVGMMTGDGDVIDAVHELYARIWTGTACRGCKVRECCEAPLDLG